MTQLTQQGCKDRELADERILGSGVFVASVLQGHDGSLIAGKVTIEEVLREVEARSGISRALILGVNRRQEVSNPRRKSYYETHARTGASNAMLGRLTGRSHVAVRKAIAQMRIEKESTGDE